MSSCLTADLKRALLAQVGCGIPDLVCFLENEIDLIWETQDECTDRLRYIYTQLGLIEAAQIFARNQIDTMTREASSQMNERYSAFSTVQADAERDASGRSCSWAAATSSQHFNRDSEDQAIGWSDYRNKYVSDIDNNGYDKSCRHTTGFGFHRTRITSFHTVNGNTFGSARSTSTSLSGGGTNGLVPLDNVIWATSPTLFPEIPAPPTLTPITPAVGEFDLCPEEFVDNEPVDTPILDCRQGYPSMGNGYSGTMQFSAGVPLLGTFTIQWSQADNKRQYFTCSRSASATVGSSSNTHDVRGDGATDASEDDNQTYSSEVTNIDHLVRKYGLTVRRATTDNDAEEQAEGFSNGVAFSESDRNARAHAYAQSRSEAESVRHAESHFLKTDRANADMISKKYGQISKHLKALWDRVWEHSLLLERQLAAKPYGGSMNCTTRSKSCLPVRRSYYDLRRVIQHV